MERERRWQPHAVSDGETDFIETRALLGLSQPEPTEESLLHRELLSSVQGTA